MRSLMDAGPVHPSAECLSIAAYLWPLAMISQCVHVGVFWIMSVCFVHVFVCMCLCAADCVFVCCRSCVFVLQVICLCAAGHAFVCCRSCVCVLQIMCLCAADHVQVQAWSTSHVSICYRSCLGCTTARNGHFVHVCVCVLSLIHI